MPQSCAMRAMDRALRCWRSQPVRIFSVTGTSTADAVQNETRLQSFAIVELATGRVLDQRDNHHRIERSKSGVDDTISNSSHSVSVPN